MVKEKAIPFQTRSVNKSLKIRTKTAMFGHYSIMTLTLDTLEKKAGEKWLEQQMFAEVLQYDEVWIFESNKLSTQNGSR